MHRFSHKFYTFHRLIESMFNADFRLLEDVLEDLEGHFVLEDGEVLSTRCKLYL